jgi:hypothetical protein
MSCDHISKLGPDYPGRYCIYCGMEVAQIEVEDGQLVLKGENKRKYLAVVYKQQQKPVAWIDVASSRPLMRFMEDEREVEFKVSSLITSFQEKEEVLTIE